MARAPYTTLPLGALLDERLSKMDYRVLLALASWRMRDHSVVWPTRHEIARRCGIHVSNVSKTTARLERLGWLKKEGGGGCSRPTTYILCDLPGVVPDDPKTRAAVARCARMRGGAGRCAETEQRKTSNGSGNDTVSGAPEIAGVRDSDAGRVRDGGAGNVRHRGATLNKEAEKEAEKETEKYARIRARVALDALVVRNRSDADTGAEAPADTESAEEVQAMAHAVPAAAGRPAGAANEAEVRQPPAERKKRPQRPEDWAGVHIPRPDDVPEQVWSDFCALRKTRRANVTQTVVDTTRAQARSVGISLAEALQISVSQGWQGFRADWVAGRGGASPATPANVASRRRMRWTNFEDQDYTAGITEDGIPE